MKLVAFVAAVTACAPARVPSIAGYRAELGDRAPTEILVVGTPHLSEVGSCLAVGELLDRLARWRPDVIAVEWLPASTVEALTHRNDEIAQDLRESFAKHSLAGAALAKTALDRGAITDRAREVLLLLAAYEYPSAVLHWDELHADERAGVPPELATMLDESVRSPDEVFRIAVPLARRLGLARVALVDDFGGDETFARRADDFARDVAAAPAVKQVASAPLYAESKQRLSAACRDPHALAVHYDWINSRDYANHDVALQWGIWFRTHFASGLDRARYAAWEARNLAIAANIRKESSFTPGKRVLVIYGAAHKPFLDAYLAQLLDVRVVQLAALASATP
jgi:hypothetical protein